MRAHPSPNGWAAKNKLIIRKYQGLRKANPRSAFMMWLPTPVNKATLERGVPNLFGRSRLGATDYWTKTSRSFKRDSDSAVVDEHGKCYDSIPSRSRV